MISVDAALNHLRQYAFIPRSEPVTLSNLCGRVTADDITSRLNQPPFNASAMDGYAVQFSDMQKGNSLKVIGEAAAGQPFSGPVGPKQAVRIFTGGVVPEGADHIIIQEDVQREGEKIIVHAPQASPRHIRPAGIDFNHGDILVRRGTLITPMHLSVLAAANIATISCFIKPRIALFTTGDELREPGAALKAGEIVNSNPYSLSALIQAWGADVEYLGCAKDDPLAIQALFDAGKAADIIVPIGGASVGDYDYVKTAFMQCSGHIEFEKVAVRPGKPVWYGRLGDNGNSPDAHILGLPGNPASAIVAATIFLRPLIWDLAGLSPHSSPLFKAFLTEALGDNGPREHYLRAHIFTGAEPVIQATPTTNQDSSRLSPFLQCSALIRREPFAKPCPAGSEVDCIPILSNSDMGHWMC